MSEPSVLIYGAYGYTGRLCVERAAEVGLRVVVGGRDGAAVSVLAAESGCDHVVFDLADGPEAVDAAIRSTGAGAVLHCAGPFSATWRRMLDGCLAAGVHYLDVTGEIDVFEGVLGRADECRAAGIAAIPGVGFDVVPTDCLAAELSEALPDATRLELAFMGVGGGVSRGTARTMVQGLGHGGAARIDGKIVPVPHVWRQRRVDLGGRERTVTSIGWGDVSTAYHTTGIPNIVVYTALPSAVTDKLKWVNRLGWLLRTGWMQRSLRRRVDARFRGPTADQRESGASHVWGRVEGRGGASVVGRLRVPEGYAFTALAAIAAAERVLDGDVSPGAWTPAKAFGKDFVRTIDGVDVEPLSRSA